MKAILTCEDAREQFSSLLDGELDPEMQDTLEKHLNDCSECLRELDGLKKVSDIYKSLPNLQPPDDLAESIRDESSEPTTIDLSDSYRVAGPVSFKPIIVAAIVLMVMAIISFLISQTMSKPPATPPELVDTTE